MSSDIIVVVPDEEASHSGTFSGDPRFEAYVFTPTKEDVRALKKDQWLSSTNLLDLILQRAGTRYDCFVDPFAPLLGSLDSEAYISSMNLTASLERKQVRTLRDWKRNQESIERLQRRQTSTKARICDATASFNKDKIISSNYTHGEST